MAHAVVQRKIHDAWLGDRRFDLCEDGCADVGGSYSVARSDPAVVIGVRSMCRVLPRWP